MRSFQFGALAAIGLLLVGCASTPLRLTLSPEQRTAMTSAQAKIIVIQDEVIVDVTPSNSGGAGAAFGLIGALVASSIDSKVTNDRMKAAQSHMVAFYAAIDDIDFRKEFSTAVEQALAQQPVKFSSVTSTPVVMSDDELRKWRDALPDGQNLVIVMLPRYRLSGDFRNFSAETWVTTWDKGKENQPIGRSVLHYVSAPLGKGGADSLAAWNANKAAAFRTVLDETISETVALMRADLNLGPAPTDGASLRDFPMLENGVSVTVKGKLVSETDTRQVVLGQNGRLFSLPKSTATVRQ